MPLLNAEHKSMRDCQITDAYFWVMWQVRRSQLWFSSHEQDLLDKLLDLDMVEWVSDEDDEEGPPGLDQGFWLLTVQGQEKLKSWEILQKLKGKLR